MTELNDAYSVIFNIIFTLDPSVRQELAEKLSILTDDILKELGK